MSTITVYHGSKEKLEMRKIDREAGVGTADGVGFYTATDIERANMYGDFITEFDLELKKELSSNEVTLSRDIIAEMVEETSYWENYGEPYGSVTLQDLVNESVDELIDNAEDDVEIIGDIINAQDATDEILDILKKHGYNYSRGAEFKTDYIVYDLDTLTITDQFEKTYEGVAMPRSDQDVFESAGIEKDIAQNQLFSEIKQTAKSLDCDVDDLKFAIEYDFNASKNLLTVNVAVFKGKKQVDYINVAKGSGKFTMDDIDKSNKIGISYHKFLKSKGLGSVITNKSKLKMSSEYIKEDVEVFSEKYNQACDLVEQALNSVSEASGFIDTLGNYLVNVPGKEKQSKAKAIKALKAKLQQLKM